MLNLFQFLLKGAIKIMSAWSRWDHTNVLQIVSNCFLDSVKGSLFISHIILLHSFIFWLTCSLKLSLLSRARPRFFWQGEVSTLLLLKIISGGKDFPHLWEKYILLLLQRCAWYYYNVFVVIICFNTMWLYSFALLPFLLW